MAVKISRGDSVPVAKVMTVTPIGVIVAGYVYALWCNGKAVSYVAQAGDTAASIVTGLAAALANTTISEFSEMLGTANGSTLTLVASVAGVPFEITATSSGNMTVVETTVGSGAVNEVWSVSLIGTYTGGTFTLTVNVGGGNVTTANIAYNATAATVQAALVALAGVGAGQVLVAGGPGPGSPWFVTWTGTLGGQSIAPGTVNGANLTGGSTVTITETQKGNGLSDEIQMLDCSVLVNQGAFTFTLTLDGQTTGTINTNSTAAAIQTALQALPNVGSGNALVYASPVQNLEPLNYIVHFTGALAATNVSQLVVNWTWGGGYPSPVVTTLQDGGQTSSDDFQWLDLGLATANPGVLCTFSVTYQGQTTGPISNNASSGVSPTPAPALQAALQAFSTIGAGNCTVYGPAHTGSTSQVVDGFLIRLTGAKANTAGSSFTATATAGSGCVVTRLSNGHANVNEVQTIWVAATGGTFTLTAGAQTTSAIAWNASSGTLQTRIQTDLAATIVACTVTGSGTFAAPWVVTVTNPANTPIALLTANSGSLTGGYGTITELTAGHAGQNEVQTVTLGLGVNGGTFTLSFNGSAPTQALAWNSTGIQVQAALLALPTINTVTVTGAAGGPWVVTWSLAQAGLPQPLLFADGSLLTGMLAPPMSVSTVTSSAGPLHYNDPNNWTPAGVPGAGDSIYAIGAAAAWLYGLDQIATFAVNSSIQTVVVSATGGTFTLTESAQTTGAIAYNATAATVRTAILAAFTNTVLSCTVTGAGTSSSPWVITMLGVNGFSLPLMTANAGSLTGGAGTVTINASTFVYTSKSSLQNGQGVYVSTSTTLPTGLAGNVIYYPVNINRDANTFQLATTVGGSPVAVTTLGAGTQTIGARPGYFEFNGSFAGDVGLPFMNPLGYVEYRTRSLHFGMQTIANGGTQQIVIGTGNGNGSGKIQLNNDVDAVALKVIGTGSTDDPGVNAVTWTGSNPASTISLITGDLGTALFPGDVAALALLTQRGGTLLLGKGTTLSQFDKIGGSVIIDGATINGVTTSR